MGAEQDSLKKHGTREIAERSRARIRTVITCRWILVIIATARLLLVYMNDDPCLVSFNHVAPV